MKGLVERKRRVAAPVGGMLLLALVLAGALGLVCFWPGWVRYHLWIDGEKVAEGREVSALHTALSTWREERMGRPLILEHEGRGWRYSMAELGLVLPLEEAERQVDQAAAQRPWWQRTVEVRLDLPAQWEMVRLEAALEPVREVVERPPQPASLAAEGAEVKITPSVDGLAIETDAVRGALSALGDAERLALPVSTVRPELTTEVVEGWSVRRLIAEWSTHYDPSIPRAENVERAARSFDGLLLKPGEVLSYNATVGPIDASTGWKAAPVIVGGELVPGIGGGVCQVTTTLYGAALRANMEILERHPHQLAVSYIPPSEDAAVAQGYQDLKIRNNTLGHLLMRTEAGGGTVTFRLYGDLPAGQEVRIESKVTGSVPFPSRTVEDRTLAPGERRQTAVGVPGITSQAHRLVFQNGQLVKRELLSQDRYLPTAAVVRVGPPAQAAAGDGN